MKISRFKRKNDSIFYDICIKAIDKSDDDLYNKKDYIKEIKSLKIKFLKKIKKNKKKIFEKKNTFEKTMIMGRTTFDELLNKHRIKENIISTLSTKVDDLPKIEIKKEAMKEENHAIKKYFLGRQSKYSVFKHIKDYLQSNDITLNEIIQKNPFQSRPFIIQGSEEFLKAVKFSEYEEVDYMLRKDKKLLFSIDYFGQTAYHWATKLSDYKMLDILLSFGKHHNQKDFKGRTPIYLAAVNNNKDMCKYLLDNNANPFLKDKDNKSPADVAGSMELKYFLMGYMSKPINNPIFKMKLKKILGKK